MILLKANDNRPECLYINKVWKDRQESQEFKNTLRLAAWQLKMIKKELQDAVR